MAAYGSVSFLVIWVTLSRIGALIRISIPTENERFKYQVQIKQNGLDFCGGSIIASKFILTSAYCTELPPDEVEIITNPVFKIKLSSKHTVKRIIRHSGYRGEDGPLDEEDDIGLLEVDPPFKFNGTLTKTRLSEKKLERGTRVITLGFVYTQEHGTEGYFSFISKNIQTAPTHSIDRETCRKRYEEIHLKISDKQICTYDRRNGLISIPGSPLMVNGSQIGIFSWMGFPEESVYPEVYTDVSKYISWIKEQTGEDLE